MSCQMCLEVDRERLVVGTTGMSRLSNVSVRMLIMLLHRRIGLYSILSGLEYKLEAILLSMDLFVLVVCLF